MKNITFVVFGGTGDLSRKKLGCAISNLAERDNITVNLVGIGRKDLTNETYKELLENSEPKFRFSKNTNVHYFKADLTNFATCKDLDKLLNNFQTEDTIGRIFYLATSYKLFELIAKVVSCLSPIKGFSRIMIEKPFGHDLKSSNLLNSNLRKYFSDDQIFRVDHYLAKETVENILLMRFSNPLFENTWKSKFIDKIKIVVHENFGVDNRIEYYDKAGAVRDMIQNHLLQVLLFILMDAPKNIESSNITKNKVNAIKSLRFNGKVLTGQYEGYRKEADRQTNTETYAEVHLSSVNKRWKGTQIILKTGKNLKTREAHITLEYKKEPCILYCNFNTAPNKLIFRIQPTQDVELTMNVKKPGDEPIIENVKMEFNPSKIFDANTIDSYEAILRQAVLGDKTMFICENVLNYSWKLADKIINSAHKFVPTIYEKASSDPQWN